MLISGLPDDVARECLIRLPFSSFPAARSVCRLWKMEIDSPCFRCRRKAAGRTQHVIAIAQVESTSASPTSTAKPGDSAAGGSPIAAYHLSLFEPATGSWSRLPSPPSLPRGLPLFSRLATVGIEVVLLGGWDPDSWAATDGVHVYNFGSGSWRRGATMPTPRRSFFACGAATGAASVLVAGGHDEEKNALRSAMAYDVGADTWAALPDMSMERDECRGVWLRGRFHVVGGYATAEQGRFSPTAEALDETTAARWDVAELELEEAGPWMRTCVVGGDGQMLYMCRGDGGEQVAALVEGAVRWRSVGEVPADVRVATQLVGWESGLMVMGLETHGGTLAAYVMEEGATAWRKVAVPEEYSGHAQEACCIEI
ncbi:F-box/kelch-repeat protein At1g80440-like [Curcuma longa]|uniref:F-box/kelch-repeat protein At1g80440-like n=1 Tax=Curcuma longa TaxID=136217 RepID=UPI003D9F9BEE